MLSNLLVSNGKIESLSLLLGFFDAWKPHDDVPLRYGTLYGPMADGKTCTKDETLVKFE